MMYLDQKCRVWSAPERTGNEIRITFHEGQPTESVTLALSLVEASWLAALIAKEIREIENGHKMTDAERQTLKVGDYVRVRDDEGIEADYDVKYAPWQLGHGEWVIGLRGISGGYRLSRVVRKLTRRCPKCGWPLAESVEQGCVPGNCSERAR